MWSKAVRLATAHVAEEMLVVPPRAVREGFGEGGGGRLPHPNSLQPPRSALAPPHRLVDPQDLLRDVVGRLCRSSGDPTPDQKFL